MNPILKTLSVAALALGTALPAMAFEDGKLTIWTGNNRDRDALLEAISGFTDDLGIAVEVEIVDPDLPQIPTGRSHRRRPRHRHVGP